MAYEKGAQTFKTKVMNKATLHTVNCIVGVDYGIFQYQKENEVEEYWDEEKECQYYYGK